MKKPRFFNKKNTEPKKNIFFASLLVGIQIIPAGKHIAPVGIKVVSVSVLNINACKYIAQTGIDNCIGGCTDHAHR